MWPTRSYRNLFFKQKKTFLYIKGKIWNFIWKSNLLFKFVRMYAVLRKTSDRPTFYYADRFRATSWIDLNLSVRLTFLFIIFKIPVKYGLRSRTESEPLEDLNLISCSQRVQNPQYMVDSSVNTLETRLLHVLTNNIPQRAYAIYHILHVIYMPRYIRKSLINKQH